MKIESTTILENAVLFSLTRRTWGNRLQADKTKLKTTDSTDENGQKKTKDRLHVSKELISDCPELDNINKALNDLYSWCLNRSMSSCLREGVYFVKKTEVENFEAQIAETIKLIKEELVPEFLKVYHSYIDIAEEDLNGQFDAGDYPTIAEMAAKFGIEHSWLEFNVPKDLPKDVKARETAKMQAQMQSAATEMVYALRESFASFVEDLTRRMEVKPGTPGKRFTAPGAVENLRDFIQRFNSINIANDVELEKAVASAKLILEGKDADNLTQSEQSRQRIKAAMVTMQAATATLIADRPKRKFNLSE